MHRIRLVILFTPVPWVKLVHGNQLSPALPSPSGTTPESFFKNVFIYLWPCWVFVAAHGLSLLQRVGAWLLIAVASRCRAGL